MRNFLLFAVFTGILSEPALAKPSAAAVARRVDELLAQEVFVESDELAPPASDEVFLRRVWLDLVGDIPAPEETIAFVLDSSPNKRQRVIAELLDKPAYGQNWARYWRDVVFSRALDEQKSRFATPAMEVDLARKLNDNVPWNEIAQEFITVRGDVLENGSTAIVMAQEGRTEETTAEVARIFLGVQIQCAQCHDHPYDRWKREQFHELAAFFPRVGVRPAREVTKRSFTVYANDRPGRRRPKDNSIRPEAEHFMPDLDDPTARGTEMQPRFFLTGDSVPLGTTDAQRRQKLAEWLTSNEWFATALLNRLWAELVGEGFYEHVDDIGPDRDPTAPKAVKLLSRKFAESGYDVKWLLTAICRTEAYGRESRPRGGLGDTPFTANVPHRLRSDQLLNAIYTALKVEEEPPPANRQAVFHPSRNTRTRQQFAEVFGYDPSIAREEVAASIPQVLALMNSPRVNGMIDAGGSSQLKQLLSEIGDDEQLVEELYLRWLCREPSSGEIVQALAHRQLVGSREAAFVDLQWALLNSVEFQYRE